jgi:hypothetical protein
MLLRFLRAAGIVVNSLILVTLMMEAEFFRTLVLNSLILVTLMMEAEFFQTLVLTRATWHSSWSPP